MQSVTDSHYIALQRDFYKAEAETVGSGLISDIVRLSEILVLCDPPPPLPEVTRVCAHTAAMHAQSNASVCAEVAAFGIRHAAPDGVQQACGDMVRY